MRVSATPIPRFASGVPSTDIGFPVFVGRFMGTGTRVGTPIHRKYAPMFSTCSKITRANQALRVRAVDREDFSVLFFLCGLTGLGVIQFFPHAEDAKVAKA